LKIVGFRRSFQQNIARLLGDFRVAHKTLRHCNTTRGADAQQSFPQHISLTRCRTIAAQTDNRGHRNALSAVLGGKNKFCAWVWRHRRAKKLYVTTNRLGNEITTSSCAIHRASRTGRIVVQQRRTAGKIEGHSGNGSIGWRPGETDLDWNQARAACPD